MLLSLSMGPDIVYQHWLAGIGLQATWFVILAKLISGLGFMEDAEPF